MSEHPPPAAPFHQRTELERAKRRWSKQELAARAGIGRVTYDRLAANTAPPIARTVHKLCAVLDIDLAEGLRLAGLTPSVAPEGEPPQWARDLQETAASLQKNIVRAGHILSAQGAMGWAYRGDLDQLQHALAAMGAEQLQELSAAATLLASVADEEMSSR